MTANHLRSAGGFLGAVAGYELWTKGVSGPFAATLLYGTLAIGITCCAAGEAIAVRDWLRRRNDRPAFSDQPNATGDAAARPEWMGDPAGNRRRLKIIAIVFVLLGVLVAAFLISVQ